MRSEEVQKEPEEEDSQQESIPSSTAVGKGGGEFLSKDDRHTSANIVFRFLKTRVAFLRDAQDKYLKELVFAKPPKIIFHEFRIGQVIYQTHSTADEIFIICQGTVEIRAETNDLL